MAEFAAHAFFKSDFLTPGAVDRSTEHMVVNVIVLIAAFATLTSNQVAFNHPKCVFATEVGRSQEVAVNQNFSIHQLCLYLDFGSRIFAELAAN